MNDYLDPAWLAVEAELDATLEHLGQAMIAIAFYRRCALDGVRINKATDEAFLASLGLKL